MHKVRVVSAVMMVAAAMILAGLAAPVVNAAAPVITSQPRQAASVGHTKATWASSNWSGYAETGHYTSVSGSWTVPTVTPGAKDSTSSWYSATWLGIDGFNDNNLIQTGIEQNYANGVASYGAWWEILPAAETPISATVKPGDTIDSSIVETPSTVRVGSGRRAVSEHVWTIKLADATRGWTFTINEAYAGAGTSAEWIVEAPEVGRSIATLPTYTFPSGSAAAGDFNTADVATTIGGSLTGAGLNFTNDAGDLIQNGVQVSTPGPTDTSATAFNSLYGATAPVAPTS